MSAPSISLRITGKNADGEYWLHLDGNTQKAGLNLGDPAGMIASALLMAATGHTYTRTDPIPSDPRVKALVEAADALRSHLGLAVLMKNPRGIKLRADLTAALAALKGAANE